MSYLFADATDTVSVRRCQRTRCSEKRLEPTPRSAVGINGRADPEPPGRLSFNQLSTLFPCSLPLPLRLIQFANCSVSGHSCPSLIHPRNMSNPPSTQEILQVFSKLRLNPANKVMSRLICYCHVTLPSLLRRFASIVIRETRLGQGKLSLFD